MKTKVMETLFLEIEWLQKVINQGIASYLQQETHENNWQDIPLPDLEHKKDYYATTVTSWKLDIYQRLTLVLAMAPYLKPEVLDVFFMKNKLYDRAFTAFGGFIDKNYAGFLPTGETVMFLVSTINSELRYPAMDLFRKDSILIKEDVIALSPVTKHLPKYSGVLMLRMDWFDYFLTGNKPDIKTSFLFPAKKINTKLTWNDLVLEDAVIDQVTEITTWLHHSSTIMKDWKLDQKLKPGYRALFYGPPGTGKTLTASLLGKTTNKDVYRVDLSLVISKYIGETEKNIDKVFGLAEDKDWILFFDEADALFGKRTNVRDAHDHYANQEVSYLLQRIENHPGVVILSSNLKNNIDEAFIRRFQSVIHFNMPSVDARYELWKNAFSSGCKLSEEIDIEELAEKYELSGGSINNVLRHCALKTVQRNANVVTKSELLGGIRKEFKKENKTISSK
jgi:AAA+ superfamily predicted ATPase